MMTKDTLPKIIVRLLTAALLAVAGGAAVAFAMKGQWLLTVTCGAIALILGVFLVHDVQKLNAKD